MRRATIRRQRRNLVEQPTFDQAEKKEELPLVPQRERLDTRQFDVGAEHASGWSLKAREPKPVGEENAANESVKADSILLRDAGEVNRVQFERIKELKMPLSDTGSQYLPVSIRSGNAPDFKSRDPSDERPLSSPNLTSEKPRVPNQWSNEASKMGFVRTSTERAYTLEADRIRRYDRHVASAAKKGLSCNYGLAPTVAELTDNYSKTSGYMKYPSSVTEDRRRVRYNPLIVPGQPRFSSGFSPSIGPMSMDVREDMPGSASVASVVRMDTEAGNELEKIVVVHPQATQNALDKGIFSPQYRNMSQYPSVIRHVLIPTREL